MEDENRAISPSSAGQVDSSARASADGQTKRRAYHDCKWMVHCEKPEITVPNENGFEDPITVTLGATLSDAVIQLR